MPLSFLTKQAHRRRQFFSAYGWIAPALGLALLLLFAASHPLLTATITVTTTTDELNSDGDCSLRGH